MTMTNKMISFAMIEIVTMMCRPRVVSVEWRCQHVSSSHESSLWPPLLDYNSETEEILSSMDINSIIAVVVRGQTSSRYAVFSLCHTKILQSFCHNRSYHQIHIWAWKFKIAQRYILAIKILGGG